MANKNTKGDIEAGEANDDRVIRLKPASKTWTEATDIAFDHFIAEAAVAATMIRVVNRGMIRAGEPDVPVPSCTVKVGAGAGQVTAQTNAQGAANLDLSALPDGVHPLSVEALHSSTTVPGPGFPQDTTIDRVFQPFAANLTLQSGKPTASSSSHAVVTNNTVRVGLWPLWMRTANSSARTEPIDMIVVHHTGTTNLRSVFQTFLNGETSAHYVVNSDGNICKLVPESRVAWHAGYSHWAGVDGMNGSSIGIEILHDTSVGLYPTAQQDAAVDLAKRLAAGHATIKPGRIVGHSDIAINDPDQRPPKLHGRKSTDPGSAFPWERLEALGLGLVPRAGTVDPNMYQGFFVQNPNTKLKQGDNGPEVTELQQDLTAVGYLCPPDGGFGKITQRALQMFQQHIWSGSRLRSDDDQWNSGDGRLDKETAEMLKRVLGEVTSGPVA
jgi:N-acetylmuramoyl-L-alanine amidase